MYIIVHIHVHIYINIIHIHYVGNINSLELLLEINLIDAPVHIIVI